MSDRASGPPTGRLEGIRVVGDVGGTNARLATVEPGSHDLERIEVLPCADYASLGDALDAYLTMMGITQLAEVCVAVAGPVHEDRVHLPNSGWEFSRRALEEALGAPLTLLNDFTAQALALDLITPEELQWVGDPRPGTPGGIQVVIGPGTGLGVAVRTGAGEILPSEGGHVGFAPATEREIEVLRLLLPRYGRVSVERLVSGPGLENLYWAESVLEGKAAADSVPHVPAQEVARRAAHGDPLALKVVRDLFDILATFAGDVALANWADGGVFLSGGVLRKLWGFFDPHRFRARFEDKGRFRGFCSQVPVAWITADYPGLLGCSAALAAHARTPASGDTPASGGASERAT